MSKDIGVLKAFDMLKDIGILKAFDFWFFIHPRNVWLCKESRPPLQEQEMAERREYYILKQMQGNL